MTETSIPTKGRTLDYAAPVYDLLEPIVMVGRQQEYNQKIVALLDLEDTHNVLDLGCGTGVLTRMIANRLDVNAGGIAVGIDAAAGMIAVARKRRETATCRFDVVAAEALPYDNESFDAVVSSLFFHHISREVKEECLHEAFRVLRPGGLLIIADMHRPTSWIGAVISYTARWLLLQPEIGENIKGVLPECIHEAGFTEPQLICTYFGYIALFKSHKPEGRL